MPRHKPNHLLFDFCRRPQNTFFINAETSAHKNRINRVQTQHPDTTANTHLQVKVCIFFCRKMPQNDIFRRVFMPFSPYKRRAFIMQKTPNDMTKAHILQYSAINPYIKPAILSCPKSVSSQNPYKTRMTFCLIKRLLCLQHTSPSIHSGRYDKNIAGHMTSGKNAHSPL